MTAPKRKQQVVRFGPFTADLDSGELRRDGVRVKLQVQPWEILKLFLERPNQLVSREELQRLLWPSDTFVDFEQGLNKAINKLRDALCDNAEDPRYIETVPKRGYRFVAGVEGIPATTQPAEEPTSVAKVESIAPPARWHPLGGLLVLVAAVLLFAAFLVWRTREPKESDGSSSGSIAVLPLLTQGSDAEYDDADGITDSLIDSLSLVPGLRVISHASVFQYRGQVVDPQAVGKRLGVAAVLTGRIELSGQNPKVKLELTATNDRRHLWGREFNLASDRAAFSQEAADAVAEALRLRVPSEQRQQIGTRNTVDAEAQQLYLKGRYYFFRESPEDVLKARERFQAAIDRDPTFALAYAALGDSYDWMATEGYQPASEVQPQARAAKSKANELNSSLAEVHASLGGLNMVEWNWPQAELEFQKALQLNPNYFEAHRLYSIYLRSMKRYPEAIEHAKLSNELNPLLMPAKSHLALTYYFAGQYSAAAEQYRSILKDDPKDPGSHAGLSSVLVKLGDTNQAVKEMQTALSLAGDERAAQEFEKNFKHGGWMAARQGILKSELQYFEKLSKSSYVSPLEFSYRFALLGNREKAFMWLEKAYSERSPQLFNINVDPDYDGLRDDPRFTRLVSRLHLPQ